MEMLVLFLCMAGGARLGFDPGWIDFQTLVKTKSTDYASPAAASPCYTVVSTPVFVQSCPPCGALGQAAIAAVGSRILIGSVPAVAVSEAVVSAIVVWAEPGGGQIVGR